MAKIVDRRSYSNGGNNKRSLSRINYIVRHCSATESGSSKAFENYWRGTLGWTTGGYHEVIKRDGTVEINYSPNVISNGVGGHNTESYHICLVGVDSFTDAQEEAFMERVLYNMNRLGIDVDEVWGHREFPRVYKSCPGIDMDIVRPAIRKKTPVGGSSKVSTGAPTYNGKSFAEAHSDWWNKEGSDVKDIQQGLKDAGFDAGPVDGIFGQSTLNAVRDFQEKYELSYHGADYYGVPGPQTLEELDKVIAEKENAPKQEGFANTHPDWWMKESNTVKQVQSNLKKIGIDAGPTDGIYGQKSLDAVREFQSKYDISSPEGDYYGVPGPSTREKLSELASSGVPSPTLRKGDNGSQVRALQKSLVSIHYYPEKGAKNDGVDGIYGPATKDAVRRFQAMYGLEQDGIYGPNTAKELEKQTK